MPFITNVFNEQLFLSFNFKGGPPIQDHIYLSLSVSACVFVFSFSVFKSPCSTDFPYLGPLCPVLSFDCILLSTLLSLGQYSVLMRPDCGGAVT